MDKDNAVRVDGGRETLLFGGWEEGARAMLAGSEAALAAGPEAHRFECEGCGYELPESEVCCCDYRGDGSIEDGRCKACCGPHSLIWDGKAVAGGRFERGE